MDETVSVFWRLLLLAPLMVTHCAGMCGPLMVAFRFGRRADGQPPRALLAGGELLAYQAGRVVIYATAGVLVGWSGERLVHALNRGALWLAMVLAVGFVLAALAHLGWLPRWARLASGTGPSFAQRLAERLVRWCPGRFPAAFALGVAMAFLPCGLALYGLAMAADAANPWSGGALMALLVVMTTPVLAPFALAPAAGLTRLAAWKRHERWVVPMMLVISAGLILYVGIARQISGHCPWCFGE